MPNDVKLQEGHPLDENLRPLKVGGESTTLELSKNAVKVKNLEVTGTAKGGGFLSTTGGTMSGDITTDSNIISTSTFTIDAVNTISLDSQTPVIDFKSHGNPFLVIDGAASPDIKFFVVGAPEDYLFIQTFVNGLSQIKTVDDAGEDAHLFIIADGFIEIQAVNHLEFNGCGVGFDKETTTFAASAVLSEGDDSTDIDFRLGNKHELTLTDDIAGSGEYINMFFPATSGNFILVLIQGVADCTINSTGWRAYASDESLCNNEAGQALPDGRVRWGDAGPPTLSTAQYDVDIISIYWDADNQTAFAMASKGF